MSVWDDLTAEQYAVMINAVEEAFINDVIDEYGARLQWAKTGSTLAPSQLDDQMKRALIPRFAGAVSELVARGWIEIRDSYSGTWEDARPISSEEFDTVLSDPDVWILREERPRMIMLGVTDLWNRVAAQPDPPHS